MKSDKASNARPSDSIVFTLSAVERGISDLILPAAPPPPKWAAINAVRHLNRGWKLRELDPGMAIFRAITAEEEAATALFLSLKRRRYSGAEKLQHKDHAQKSAVSPFLQGAQRVFGKMGAPLPPTSLVIDPSHTPPQLKVKLLLPVTDENGTRICAFPEPPLHLSLRSGVSDGQMKPEDFATGIEELVAEAGTETILNHVQGRATVRNRILYATSQGIPEVGGDVDRTFNHYRFQTFAILKTYLLIDPHPLNQDFVQQCLFAFLKMLDRLPKDIEF